MIEPITLLVVDSPQSQHVPKLDMYSLKPIETKNDMSFYLVETSEGTYLLSCWKHNIINQGCFDSTRIPLAK